MELIEAANLVAAGGKAQRGMTSTSYAVDRYGIDVDLAALVSADTEVARGSDAHIDVEVPALPPNADVEECLLLLYSMDSDSPPAAQTTGVDVTKDGAKAGSFSLDVKQPTIASNVRVMLGEEIIWTLGGPLTEQRYELPDASAAVNAWLEKQTSATAPLATLSFVVQSDTSGKVGLRLLRLNFSQVKTQSWPNPLDNTIRSDRTQPVGFGAILRLPLDPLVDRPEAAVALKTISLDVDSKFDTERLLARVETHDGREFATVSTEYSIAQAFTLTGPQGAMLHSPVSCTGVAACVSVDEEAELYAEIQGDKNGAPSTGAPLGKGTIAVTPPAAGAEAVPWATVKFNAPVPLDVDTPFWLVLKAVQGSANVALVSMQSSAVSTEAFSRSRLCVSRTSQVWKDFTRDPKSRKAALAGVIYQPAKDDQSAATQVAMSGVPQSDLTLIAAVDPGTKPQTFSYSIGAADWRQTSFELRSYASGTLHIANVVQRFRLK